MQTAVQQEIDGPVQRAWPQAFEIIWHAVPQPFDWPVYLVPAASWHCPAIDGAGCWGYHTLDPVAAYVRWDNNDLADSEYVFSHEVIEMAADPYGQGTEICDPVDWQGISIGGVRIAKFVDPSGTSNY